MNEFTKEDYKSALKVWSKWNTNYTHFDTFKEYCEAIIKIPEPKPKKITWQQISDLIENFKHNNYLPHKVYIADLVRILERIKTDHL